MRFKQIGLNTLIYAAYFFGSCVVVMLAESLLMFLVDKFVMLPYFVLTIMRIVIYSAGVPALAAYLGYREGYREAVCNPGETIISGVLATAVPHLLFAMLFHYQPFVSGAVLFTAGLIHNGTSVTEYIIKNETPYLLFVAVFMVYGLIYTGALTVCKYYGAKKRVEDRIRMGVAKPAETPEE